MNENIHYENLTKTTEEDSFMKKLLKKRLNQKGLTLIELLAVIVILAIVAAIAIPAIGNVINNSRVGAIKGDAQTALSAANIYFTDNGTANGTTISINDLLDDDLLDSSASLTTTGNGEIQITKNSDGNTISGTGTAGGITVTFTNANNNAFTQHNNSDNGTAADPDATPAVPADAIVVSGR